MHVRYLWPDGRSKALTFSYDDARTQDRRLVSIFNAHGVRGSFHLNGGLLGKPEYVTAGEVVELYAGHEVSAHGLTHPWLSQLPADRVASEVMEDRRRLEGLVGYVIRGMSYPYGHYSPSVVAMLPSLGIEYARVVPWHGGFGLPDDLLTWQGTCHHRDRLMERGEALLSLKVESRDPALMYVWGHSYEFDGDPGWELIEGFCARMGRNDSIWYATNIEIADYILAMRNLRFSADGAKVYNPSAIPVFLRLEGKSVTVGPGQTI